MPPPEAFPPAPTGRKSYRGVAVRYIRDPSWGSYAEYSFDIAHSRFSRVGGMVAAAGE